jgi:hypothetical protein
MNIAYRCIDTFTVKVHDLHPVLKITNFLETKKRCFSNSIDHAVLDWVFSVMPSSMRNETNLKEW